MIALETLEEMFASMRATPQMNVEGPLLWGYFFFDQSVEALDGLAQSLKANGYVLVRLERTDDRSSYVLHVERIEKHTPQSLFDRNFELEDLASAHGVASYDGMDVGPVVTENGRAI